MKDVLSDSLNSLGIQLIYAGEPATQNHGVGIDDGHKPAQAATEIVKKAVKGLPALPVPTPSSSYDLLHFQLPTVSVMESPLHP